MAGRKRRKAKSYVPRIVPKISTSTKVFVDKKTRSRHRRILNRQVEDL